MPAQDTGKDPESLSAQTLLIQIKVLTVISGSSTHRKSTDK
jgi:hypothetical protein